MAVRSSIATEARAEGRKLQHDAGREIKIARIGSGTSQREAGARVGMSHSELGRIERGALQHLTVD
jgi:ribosome-binding protein aMBF1 (putative translation factor)